MDEYCATEVPWQTPNVELREDETRTYKLGGDAKNVGAMEWYNEEQRGLIPLICREDHWYLRLKEI